MLSLPHDSNAYWSLLRRSALAVAKGLIAVGAANTGMDPREALEALDPATPATPAADPHKLPAAHPECLAADIPPTDVERDLWARLT